MKKISRARIGKIIIGSIIAVMLLWLGKSTLSIWTIYYSIAIFLGTLSVGETMLKEKNIRLCTFEGAAFSSMIAIPAIIDGYLALGIMLAVLTITMMISFIVSFKK